ncbi:Hypothetical predicted protein [Olea europaea subsp. europaea]|uniref:Uncharacterized protein n=1 Tax=Olea europaea subsp. europaea TaxID=158383 RepID=A0A8S0PUQ4_OLEEU|nr:Hypothetical predicted protein [Olea europaea subsp. europaea]
MASSTTGRKEVTPTIATQLGAQMYKTRRNGKTTVMLSCAKPPDRRHRHCYNIHPSSLFITWKTTIEDHRAVIVCCAVVMMWCCRCNHVGVVAMALAMVSWLLWWVQTFCGGVVDDVVVMLAIQYGSGDRDDGVVAMFWWL